MDNILTNWKSSTKTKRYMLISIIVFLSIVAALGGWYYHSMQEKENAKLAQEKKESQERANKKSITDFYNNAFIGMNIEYFFSFINESEKSRIPLLISGFTETQYSCDYKSCDFTYQLMTGAIFNSQKKILFNEEYDPVFSENSLEYTDVRLNLNDNILLNKFNKNESITAPICNDFINFIYSYNTSKLSKDGLITIEQLPSNSVQDQENSYSDYQHSYGLLVGEFSVVIPDSYSEAYNFWQNKPYKDFFLITNIDKSSTNNNNLLIKGNFICKK